MQLATSRNCVINITFRRSTMNRENKRKNYEKGYYKTHPCEESFLCKNCGYPVSPMGAGTEHRNHCPNCLCSLHLDIEPGDRAADCGGIMEPISVWVRKKRRMGNHSPLQAMRLLKLEPRCSRRQSHETHVDCHEACC